MVTIRIRSRVNGILESLGIKSNEPAVYDQFLNDITFDGDRYQVKLPFKENHPPLPDNYQLSKTRLESLVRRLKSNPELLKQYDQVIQEQLQVNIIEPVSDEERFAKKDSPIMIHYLIERFYDFACRVLASHAILKKRS